MNTQKGFAPILLILAGLIVIGGGVYFYTNSYQKNEQSNVENNIETSTSTPEQPNSASKESKKEVAQVTDYSGFYVFSESGGKTLNGAAEMMIIYTLDISKENNEYVAYLNIDGYQTMKRIKAQIKQEGNDLSVLFENYLPGNIGELYQKGNLLFKLDGTNKDKMKTSWYSIEPAFTSTDSLNNSYFEKDKNIILNVDEAKKNIVGKWKSVENGAPTSYMIIFREDGTYQADVNAGADYGTWKILENLRNEKDADDIQRDVPNGAYLKLTQTGELPLYYVILKSDANSIKYIYMSGTASAATFDLVKIK